MTLSVPRFDDKVTIGGSRDSSAVKGRGMADAPTIKKTPVPPEETDHN